MYKEDAQTVSDWLEKSGIALDRKLVQTPPEAEQAVKALNFEPQDHRSRPSFTIGISVGFTLACAGRIGRTSGRFDAAALQIGHDAAYDTGTAAPARRQWITPSAASRWKH